MQYHHTGVITEQQQPGEVYVEATKVWVTNPDDHPYKVEFLRFEPDTPVVPPLRDHCHTAYTVDDLGAAIAGKNVVLGPFDASLAVALGLNGTPAYVLGNESISGAVGFERLQERIVAAREQCETMTC